MRLLFCLGCLLALPALGAPLSRGERDRALSELHATRKQFLDSISGLSPAQWNFRPSGAAWSLAQIAEHLALVEEALFRHITGTVLTSPAAPRGGARPSDGDVLRKTLDRSFPAQATDAVAPKGAWTPAESIGRFRSSRDHTIAWVRATGEDLRAHAAAHPFGELDAYQWVLFLSAHTGRHVVQAAEVKAAPGFPPR